VSSGKRSLAAQHTRALLQPQVSPDERWVALAAGGRAPQKQIMVAPLYNGVAAGEKEWLTITDGSGNDDAPNWSPDGNLLCFYSHRDGFCCIWGQKLDPARKTPVGPAFAVYHSHDPRRSIRNVWVSHLTMSASDDQIVFPMGELTGNIWITEYREPP